MLKTLSMQKILPGTYKGERPEKVVISEPDNKTRYDAVTLYQEPGQMGRYHRQQPTVAPSRGTPTGPGKFFL